jgi:diguanylate cyclase (GGDEF)-like protein
MGFAANFSHMNLNADMPAIRQIIEQKKPLITNDFANSQYSGCLPEGCSINSLICLPIIVNDQVKAILHLDSFKTNAFSNVDVDFALLAAREASLAVERALLFSKVMDMSIKDELTGCYNRRKLDLDIEAKFAEAKLCQSDLSCLMIDIDFFKQFNDSYGHAQGDQCLKRIAGLIEANIRPEDALYRYGGEEFTVLLSRGGNFPAMVAERLRDVISQSSFAGIGHETITVSIGVAIYPSDAKKPSEFLKMADSRLYAAKESGRNRVVVQ